MARVRAGDILRFRLCICILGSLVLGLGSRVTVGVFQDEG